MTVTQEEFELDLLLQALGYIGIFQRLEPEPEYIKLVEKFTYYPAMPLISVTAYQVLCCDWELTEHYLDKIKSLMKGEDWDYDGAVKVEAMCNAGWYIQKSQDKECLEILLDILGNKNKETSDRQLAYRCILRGFGLLNQINDNIDPDHYAENPQANEIINKAREIVLTKNKI